MGDALRTLTADGAHSTPALVTLVLFFLVFVGILIWTFRKGSKERYDEAARLPFGDERSNHGA